MKRLICISTLSLLVYLSSCNVQRVQIMSVASDNKMEKREGNLVFEDENCKLTYNFWGNGGDMGFRFFNKTNTNIYVDLGESFVVKNGFSNPYFSNRTFTTTRGVNAKQSNSNTFLSLLGVSSAASSVSTSGEYSVSQAESRIVCIPPDAYIVIADVNRDVLSDIHRDCDELGKRELVKDYKKENSPFVFKNIISYTIGSDDNADSFIIDNEFYLSRVENRKRSSVVRKRKVKECSNSSGETVEVYVVQSPDKFYIPYRVANKTAVRVY